MKPNDTALRKRTQISHANRTMFVWIAAASALVSFAIVASIFLSQKLFFNEKVLSEKNNTIQVLSANNAAIPELEANIRALDANADLAKAKVNTEDQAIRVILDALPSDANSLALGASLQNKLLAGIPGLSVESLQVEPVQGVESLSQGGLQDAGITSSDSQNQISFSFSVSGNQEALRQALTNLERSIRTIDIVSLRVENQGVTQIMTVVGRAFYEPAKNVTLYEKVVKP
jgi:hypothetical protein